MPGVSGLFTHYVNVEKRREARETITGEENPRMSVCAREKKRETSEGVQVPVLAHLKALYTWRRPYSVWPAARLSQAPIVNPWECLRLPGHRRRWLSSRAPSFCFTTLGALGDGGEGRPFRLRW